VIHGVKIGGAKDVAQDWRSQRCGARLAKPKMRSKIGEAKDAEQDWRSQRCGARLAKPKMFHKMLRKITW